MKPVMVMITACFRLFLTTYISPKSPFVLNYSMSIILGMSAGGDSSFLGQLSQLFFWNRDLSYETDIEPVNKEVEPPCKLVNIFDLLHGWSDFMIINGMTRIAPARCQDKYRRYRPTTGLLSWWRWFICKSSIQKLSCCFWNVQQKVFMFWISSHLIM